MFPWQGVNRPPRGGMMPMMPMMPGIMPGYGMVAPPQPGSNKRHKYEKEVDFCLEGPWDVVLVYHLERNYARGLLPAGVFLRFKFRHAAHWTLCSHTGNKSCENTGLHTQLRKNLAAWFFHNPQGIPVEMSVHSWNQNRSVLWCFACVPI